MRNIFVYATLFFCVVFFNCTGNAKTEKHQNTRNNITNVKERVREIETGDVLIGSITRLTLIDNYMIISDSKSFDMLIHLFDRSNYKYVTSAIPKGQGPGEIALMGYIGVNNKKKEFYVSDNGKQKIFCYPIDSILNNPFYIPETKLEIKNEQIPSRYEYINDTLSYARIIEPTGNVGHNEAAAKWNMQTGRVNKIRYSHPKVDKIRISLAVSIDNERFVVCYHNHDLITIMDLEGNLKYNVYGNNWNRREASQFFHFRDVVFRKDKIIASYAGGALQTDDRFPHKLLIFSTDGDYIKTLDIGYLISDFCYDEQNDRLVFSFNDMIQFGYLDLKGILD